MYTITADTDPAAASAAWQALTSYVTTSTQEANDSYILVANGSTLQIGTELLSFETAEDLKLDKFNDIAALKKNIQDHVTLNTEAQGLEGSQIQIELKKGTKLAVGQSVATLNKDITVTVNGISNMSSNMLSTLRNLVNSNADNRALVIAAVQMFDGLVGQMDSQTINVTIQ